MTVYRILVNDGFCFKGAILLKGFDFNFLSLNVANFTVVHVLLVIALH